jgi:hypothetical protein
MSQYQQLTASIPNVDSLTIWTSDGEYYWPDPAKVYLWNGTSYQKDNNTAIADLPDHLHVHKDYIEHQPLLFLNVS